MGNGFAARMFASQKSRWIGVGIFALLAVAGAVYLWRYDPTAPGAIFAPCWFQRLTGLFCPGCGATRSGHALLHGRVAVAAGYNLFFVLTVILIPIPLMLTVRRWVRGDSQMLLGATARRWVFWIPWLVIAFTILRNLPWVPFSWLAP